MRALIVEDEKRLAAALKRIFEDQAFVTDVVYDGKSGTEYSKIVPTYRDGNAKCADLTKIFPSFVTEMLRAGIVDFGRKIKGYDERCVPLTGVETRTSAPVRILRGDDLVALGKRRIYPCGEGAGWAGGITSAAVDGLKCAESYLKG